MTLLHLSDVSDSEDGLKEFREICWINKHTLLTKWVLHHHHIKRHTERLFGLCFCFKVRLYLSLNYLAAVATYGPFHVLILGQNESLLLHADRLSACSLTQKKCHFLSHIFEETRRCCNGFLLKKCLKQLLDVISTRVITGEKASWHK